MSLKKRTIRLAKHNTSIALEPEFWRALEAMAAARGLTLAALTAEIDQARSSGGLASALRIAVLKHLASPRAS